jgi:hypothetical protein
MAESIRSVNQAGRLHDWRSGERPIAAPRELSRRRAALSSADRSHLRMSVGARQVGKARAPSASREPDDCAFQRWNLLEQSTLLSCCRREDPLHERSEKACLARASERPRGGAAADRREVTYRHWGRRANAVFRKVDPKADRLIEDIDPAYQGRHADHRYIERIQKVW